MHRLKRLLPEVRAVLTIGDKARDRWLRNLLPQDSILLPTLACPHPSPQVLNVHPGYRTYILSALRRLKAVTESSGKGGAMHADEQQAWLDWLAMGWPDTVNPSKFWFFSGWQYEPVEAARWREAVWNATVKRDPSKAPSEAILASEARSWCEAEFTIDEAVPWFAVTDHYGDARTWQSLAFQPHQAAAYIAASTNDSPSTSTLALWRQAGLSADQIVAAVAAGLALNEALDLAWTDPETAIALDVLAALRRPNRFPASSD